MKPCVCHLTLNPEHSFSEASVKTLLLMRHAKSSWANETLTDHQRPLNRRGLEAAQRMGRLLASEDLLPDRIVTSTAERARRTAELVAGTAGFTGDLVASDTLYHATAGELLEVVTELDAGDGRVLLIGHNPGMEEVLYRLTREYQSVVTATLAHLQFGVAGWSEIASAPTARLLALWRPRELE